MNSRFVLALAISAGMALLVTGIFYQIAMRGPSTPVEEVGMTEIVVAVKDLEIGSSIAATQLRMEKWPTSRLPVGSFTEIEQVIERAPLSRILSAEPILDRRLAPPGSGVGLSPKVPEGMRAMSVRVDDVNGVAGFVLPESKVDLLITGVPHGQLDGGHRTRTILGNVRVISAGEQLESDGTGRPQRVPVVTLLLEPAQAELVTLAQSQGRIQLLLRNTNDEAVPKTEGVDEGELFGAPKKPQPRSGPRIPQTMARFEPLPPPSIEVEMIHGTERSVASFVGEER